MLMCWLFAMSCLVLCQHIDTSKHNLLRQQRNGIGVCLGKQPASRLQSMIHRYSMVSRSAGYLLLVNSCLHDSLVAWHAFAVLAVLSCCQQ
jgi:hypothetical protein